jgi:hypothetical protein
VIHASASAEAATHPTPMSMVGFRPIRCMSKPAGTSQISVPNPSPARATPTIP